MSYLFFSECVATDVLDHLNRLDVGQFSTILADPSFNAARVQLCFLTILFLILENLKDCPFLN